MHRSSLFFLSSICSIFRFVNNNLPEKAKIPRYIFTFARQHYVCKQEKRKEASNGGASVFRTRPKIRKTPTRSRTRTATRTTRTETTADRTQGYRASNAFGVLYFLSNLNVSTLACLLLSCYAFTENSALPHFHHQKGASCWTPSHTCFTKRRSAARDGDAEEDDRHGTLQAHIKHGGDERARPRAGARQRNGDEKQQPPRLIADNIYALCLRPRFKR